MAHIISSDDIKNNLPGYDPRRAGEFHKKSTVLADQAYEKALKSRPEKTVILMSGGSASGKSEYVSAYLKRRRVIISDGTSSTFSRVREKIEKALEAGKKIEVYAVWPESFLTAFIAFLNRERQFSVDHFYRTHSQCRATLLEIAHHFPDIPINLITSNYYQTSDGQKMIFSVLTGRNRSDIIEYLQQNQYTEEYIRNAILHDI